MVSRARKKKRKKKQSKLTLKRAVKAIAKSIYVHLVKLPEEERERDIAAFERAVSKKLKGLRKEK
jgi:hypothetical protein